MQIEFTTRGLLSNFFRQRVTLVTVFLLIAAAGVAYAVFAKPVYEANGSLLIKFGQDTPEELSHTDQNPSVISQDDRREIMQSNVDILQSHNLLLAMVNEIGPERLYPGITERAGGSKLATEAAIRDLLKGDLTIKSSQLSNVVDIRMQNENPRVAAWFVHRMMERFIVRQSEIYNKPQLNFLQGQIKQAAAKLSDSQLQLETFKAQKGISSIEEELAELLRQKSDAGTAALEPVDDSAWDRLSELQGEESRLRTVYRADSPQVVRAQESVRLAQSQLRQRQGEFRARTDHAAARINARIALLEAERSQYNDLMRQVEIDEKNYKNYQLLGEQARVNETLNQKNITSVVVVDEPTVPVKPSRPRKLLIIVLSLLFGGVLSIGTAMAFETYDQRFSSPEQLVQALGIPVMACFNHHAGEST